MTGEFKFRHGISATQIPIFSVFLFFGTLFYFQKKNGWFSIALFSIIRLTGASCMLATLANGSYGVWAAVYRANTFAQVLTPWHFRVPELICWAGMGLSIADYATASQREDAAKPGSLAQASMGLFVALYAWALLLGFYLIQRWSSIPEEERWGMWSFGACVPFMIVRTTYSVAFTATGDKKFSAVVGRPYMYLFMSLVMETTILGIVTWAIYTMSRLVATAPKDSVEGGSYRMMDMRDER
ncbi:uncharacterized protein NECHADRAFT_83009 [Fusarium vanettenii 77-13-4]|uniref:DUF7702 domain-containing protein n=1 Tax=Fusarium vanettenii (strain ATCC MYA-4622 / CBS 123669 / FGSC 9596 / NRRL 45880 / 77-13-4) TaxID=660122 RepID=C7ZB86_FUSV7|nr:uncharacterized protein NECHADRAFT_83009 [Fusarium vanettenii 77-13-4]EEU38650.1 hypothetical protein NECHADRAFT_83009 [Fusarium vanettenii 77-13-4]